MATRHAARFSRSSGPLLIREHGEPITYYRGGGLTGRCINAIVERDVEVPSGSDGQVALAMIVRVLDDCTLGISSTEINDGLDSIALPIKAGGESVRRKITRRIDDANGMIRLLVR